MLATLLTLVTSVALYSLLFLVALWCWYQWSYRDLIRNAEKLPCVYPRWPLLGHLYYTLGALTNVTACLIQMYEETTAKGLDAICFWAGPVPLIIVQNPKDIKKLLNSSSSLPKGNEMEKMFKRFVDEGLLTATAEHWKLTRRHMNPLFHPRNLEFMMPLFNQNSLRMVKELEAHVGQGEINSMHPLMQLGLVTVCQLIFGKDVEVDTKSKEFEGLLEFIEWIPEVFISRIIKMWYRNDFIFNLMYGKEIAHMEAAWQKFTERPLKKARETYLRKKAEIKRTEDAENEETPEEEELMTAVGVYCWMQENFPNITEKSLNEEMVTLYLTGTDTVGTGVGSCFLALAYYQDIQEKVYNEIISELGHSGDVTTADLRRLPYLEQVLKETLRFFTIVPYVSRRSTEEYKLGDCVIPKETTIFMCLAGLHMDPKTYPEPHKFLPERFAPEKVAEMDRYSYIPFSGGPRNCIGKTYSYMLMKVLLVHVLRKYRLTTSMDIHNLKTKYCVTMVSSEGYNVEFHLRNPQAGSEEM